MCTPETDEDTPTDSNLTATTVATAQTTTAAAARRRWHRHLGCCRRGGDRAALVLAAPAGCTCCALPLRCLCLCLWLRLWGTAAAAPLPVEDREDEEAPRAHLRELGLSPPGARTRAEPREKVHLMPAAGEENFAPRPESSAKMTGSRMAFASRG